MESDGYRYIPILWAALIALSVPGLYYAYLSLSSGGWVDATQLLSISAWLYPLQVLVFLGLGMLFQIPAARMWIIPKSVKHQRAARFAREQFFLQNLHQTRDRTGVLVFVSVAEHYVEIIVDSGIADVVDNQIWQQSVTDFIDHVHRGQIAEGFDSTIEHCRKILWEHFPADTSSGDSTKVPTGVPYEKPGELPNHLIEV